MQSPSLLKAEKVKTAGLRCDLVDLTFGVLYCWYRRAKLTVRPQLRSAVCWWRTTSDIQNLLHEVFYKLAPHSSNIRCLKDALSVAERKVARPILGAGSPGANKGANVENKENNCGVFRPSLVVPLFH